MEGTRVMVITIVNPERGRELVFKWKEYNYGKLFQISILIKMNVR